MNWPADLKAERKRVGFSQAETDAFLKLGKGQTTAWETERNTPHEIMQEGVIARLKKLPSKKP